MAANRGVTRRQALIGSTGAGLAVAGSGAMNAFAAQSGATPQAGGNAPTRPYLTLETAQTALDAALDKATDLGVPEIAVVLDEGANLKAFARQDGAILASVTIAQNKATTAVSFGAPTHQLASGVGEDPVALASISNLPDVILFPGGYPIMLDGALVGAIGVSGGTGEQDQQCAEAGLAAIGAS